MLNSLFIASTESCCNHAHVIFSKDHSLINASNKYHVAFSKDPSLINTSNKYHVAFSKGPSLVKPQINIMLHTVRVLV